MINDAERRVRNFYNTVGWNTENDISEDAKRWEDLRENAAEYVSKCRLRVLGHMPEKGEYILDMASGPIQYKEYLEYSKNYDKRYCVDLSLEALELAKKRIGEKGVFLHGSFFDIPLEENYFDCAISLHTIYHIDKDRQEEAVRKLICVTKPGKPVIVVYGNPKTFVAFLRLPYLILKKKTSVLLKYLKVRKEEEDAELYYYTYPIEWWNRFEDVANVKILPWRSFDSETQKLIIPDNKIGKGMLDMLFSLEDKYSDFFVKYFQYPMIILTKHTRSHDDREGTKPL